MRTKTVLIIAASLTLGALTVRAEGLEVAIARATGSTLEALEKQQGLAEKR